MKKNVIRFLGALSFVTIALTSCNKDDDNTTTPAIRPDVEFYALTDANQLLKLNAKTAETPTATVGITGLPSGEKILSIDFRPATGQLYGLGSSSRLYTINRDNGAASALGTASFSPVIGGTNASIDFNPTVDRIRLVSNSGQNLRLHPETGGVAASDGVINGGSSPSITSIAYTNSVSGATTTDLFDIDVTTKKLYKQMPPNDGTLAEVGTINVNFTGKGGFDISPDNSIVLATFTVDSKAKLYTLNTTNANATYLADLSAANIIDIAIPTNPVAYAVDESNNLQYFNPTQTTAPVNKAIGGLGAGESIVGIDFRPSNGQLYGLAVTAAGAAKVYTFNLGTGAVTAVGTGFTVATTNTQFGFDFNPTVDLIRVVGNAGINLRLNPTTGVIQGADGNLNPGSPAVHAAAYTNSFPGATMTTLFVADLTKLYRQDPPNVGTLVEIGALGVTVEAMSGFDIGGRTNTAYGLFTVGGATRVYSINTTTGAATAGVTYPNKVKAMSVGLGL